MSLEAEIKSGSLERGRFRYFPVVPGRLEFADRAAPPAACARNPTIVAVELPGISRRSYHRALARLPEMSVILYTRRRSDRGRRAIYVPVEPAIRSPKRCAPAEKLARR